MDIAKMLAQASENAEAVHGQLKQHYIVLAGKDLAMREICLKMLSTPLEPEELIELTERLNTIAHERKAVTDEVLSITLNKENKS